MKTRAILLSMVAAAFVSFAMPSSSFACTQPPNYPAAAQHLQLWPAYAGVGIVLNNVPNAPTTTAIGNWNTELNVLWRVEQAFELGARFSGSPFKGCGL